MPDYKEMYLHMVRESERAIDLIIAAQRKCEEMYINAPEAEITLLTLGKKEEDAPE